MLSTKEEIVQQLDETLKAPEFERQIQACSSLIERYLALDIEEKMASGQIEEMAEDDVARQEESEDAEAASKDPEAGELATSATEEEAPEEQEKTDPLHEKMLGLIDQYNEKRSQLFAQIEQEQEENLKRKRGLLEELRALIEEEEHIGKAFKNFNAIRDAWADTGSAPAKDRQQLHHDYSNLMELFYYNINIYKELKDHDLKRNLELKQGVLQQLKNLQKLEGVKTLEEGVNACIERWNAIGPTYREEWDKIKEEFWTVVRQTYDRIRDYHKERKEVQLQNLAAKEALVKEVEALADLDLRHIKKWQEKTDEVIALQEKWKTIGYATRERHEAVWKEFRSACDQFFDRKRAFFKDIRKEQDAHAKQKEALIEKAKQHKESTDWKNSTRALIDLQKAWKAVGPAHQRDEQKLWKEFRGICDHFFSAKKEFFATKDQREADNLKQKEAVIAEIKAFEPTGDKVQDLAALKDFTQRFNAIDFVPFKDKDRIYKAYKEAIDEKYKDLKMERREREAVQFQNRIESLAENDDNRSVEREARQLRDRKSKLEAEVNQLENNLGFFANSKGAEALKQDVEKKISRVRDEIESIEHKLRMVKKIG